MNMERLLKVIIKPHVTNKVYSSVGSCVVFRVFVNSDKPQIKQAVETLFEVKVDSIKVVNVKGKTRRFKNVVGRTKNWKKAYVRLQKDYNINFVDAD